MIKISFSLFYTVYISIIILGLMAFWLINENKNKSRSVGLDSEKFFWQCAICTYTYVDSQHKDISICPRCGSYNKKEARE